MCYVTYPLINSHAAEHAHLVLSPTICTWLQAFIRFMRNKIPGAGTRSNDQVFMSYTANAMSSSMVSTQLNSFWQKATGKVLVGVDAALFRKAAVSAIHEEHGNLKKDPADLMGHNQKITEKFYLIRLREKTATKTSEALHNIMYRNNQKDADKGEQLPDDVVSQHMSSQADQSDGKLESGRHCWTDEENRHLRRPSKRNH